MKCFGRSNLKMRVRTILTKTQWKEAVLVEEERKYSSTTQAFIRTKRPRRARTTSQAASTIHD
jgi:hypothetical protein